MWVLMLGAALALCAISGIVLGVFLLDLKWKRKH